MAKNENDNNNDTRNFEFNKGVVGVKTNTFQIL
jgi:hypothetical protein